MHTQSFLDLFIKKGFMHQCTNIDLLKKMLAEKKIIAYIGFDCTAKSLHVGNLMQIMVLRLLQQTNNKPIVLIGAGTTKLGDPTGKDKIRKMLSNEEIEENIVGIKKSLEKFIKFSPDNKFDVKNNDCVILNNDSWLSSLKYIEFLRNFGAKISINEMVKKDVIKNRLDQNQNISLLELNYMVCQGYDFFYLNKNYNCTLQIGGSDQWSNIISGVDMLKPVDVIGLTTKLLTNANGEKMGKTVSGAVWLNEEMLLPYDYFQYWRNVDDRDVLKIANLYAEIPDVEMDQFENLVKTNINKAKEDLAFRLTKICHGEEKAALALSTAAKLFTKNNEDSIASLLNLQKFQLNNSDFINVDNFKLEIDNNNKSQDESNAISTDEIKQFNNITKKYNNATEQFSNSDKRSNVAAEQSNIAIEQLSSANKQLNNATDKSNNLNNEYIILIDILVKFNLTKSKGAAKDLITGGGVYVNDLVINNIKHLIKRSDFKLLDNLDENFINERKKMQVEIQDQKEIQGIDYKHNIKTLNSIQYIKLSIGKKKHYLIYI